MKRIILLTGSEPRHSFFRRWVALDPQIEVLQSYCEGLEKSLGTLVERESDNALRMMHLRAREQSEEDFFQIFLETTPDRSHPIYLPKGEINAPQCAEAIRQANPDLLMAYGCSIIREPLLSLFAGRFFNIHLGLSPYYRGSGTNYWPLVNGEPEYVGVTFMHIDAGVDTGEIVHQISARYAPGDTAVQAGNRLIIDMARTARALIRKHDQLAKMPQPPLADGGKYYRKKDYSEDSVARLYENFHTGMIARFLGDETARRAAVALVRNPALAENPA